jgi:hypothetical protein
MQKDFGNYSLNLYIWGLLLLDIQFYHFMISRFCSWSILLLNLSDAMFFTFENAGRGCNMG